MRETLVPIFGESGAVIAQYVVTFLVVLILVALVIWAIRRYSGGGLGAAARGRLPRLAIVDAMAVDNRRRLVLVRRDNVEHLILIGGPTDIVVEPQIIRTRTAASTTQRSTQPGQPVRAPSPTPSVSPPAPPPPPPPAPASSLPAPPVPSARRVAPAPESDPIPFPPRRPPLVRPTARRPMPAATLPEPAGAAEPGFTPTRRGARAAAADRPANGEPDEPAPIVARFEETTRPTRVDQMIVEEEVVGAVPEPEPPPLPTMAMAGSADVAGETALPRPPAESESEPMEFPESEAPATAGDLADVRPAAGPPAVAKVSDLEKEMARLLGEISGRRGP